MKVLTFGEIMLRLKAPGHERFFQSPMLEATFGGDEANVAVSLANYGMDAEFLTVLPQNDIADACIRELWYFGVDGDLLSRSWCKPASEQGRLRPRVFVDCPCKTGRYRLEQGI